MKALSNAPIRFITDKHFTWMSNFHYSPLYVNWDRYPTAEHFYQAAKTNNFEEAQRIRTATTPKEAKELGRACTMRSDWESVKRRTMYQAVWCKFVQSGELAQKLLDTGTRPIEENTKWDSYWGTGPDGKGQNEMGKILMEVREDIRKQGICTLTKPDQAAKYHPDAGEHGDQESGWPSGDIAHYRCPNCDLKWREELPQ